MNAPLGRSYGLVERGQAGLECDRNGVTLGAAALAQASVDERGFRRCAVRAPGEIGQILRAAYGPQPDEVVSRIHRGLSRAAAWIETGDLGRAGVEVVMLRLPGLASAAVAKLAEMADLEKGGAAWESEPRLPAGQAGGGQWTADGGGSGTAAKPVAKPAEQATPEIARPAGREGVSSNPRPVRSPSLLDDGLYRPGVNDPVLIPVGGGEDDEEDEDEPPSIGSNGPPADPTSLEDVFPGLKDAPVLETALAPVDRFLGFSALANAANLAATWLQYRSLLAEIKEIDPKFEDDELLPPEGIKGLSWEGRANLINSLRMQRAAVYFRIRGDIRPLQVETLRFLKDAVDKAYEEGVEKYETGQLEPRLSREEAIGNYMDRQVRLALRNFFNENGIPYGRGQSITINNRDYDTSSPGNPYRIPDARLGDICFDWTLAVKRLIDPQIRGFLFADSRPRGVVIVRPSKSEGNSIYFIPRPTNLKKVLIDDETFQILCA